MIIKNKTVLAWAPRPPPPRWKGCFLIKHQSQGIWSLRKGLPKELRGRLFWRAPMATEVPGLVRASLWTCLQEASCEPRLCCSYSLLSSRSWTFAKHVRLLLCAVHSPPYSICNLLQGTLQLRVRNRPVNSLPAPLPLSCPDGGWWERGQVSRFEWPVF